ncbi:ankyrin repeat domain-containing protein [Thiolapillus sp.]|uniref:ankyrin repeat domain-containing protein n=1 Tax=Thiolapillus sp. TaxID=2017437 RepID=UPI0025E6D5C5|nr:ankyrin repeat domain-containing protein [Thiolapillus sp.]
MLMNDADTQNALAYAIRKGDMLAIARLLNTGANINGYNSWGDTPLMEAARTGQTGIARLLLGLGADTNLPYRNADFPAIYYAAVGGYTRTFRLLIDSGANLEHRCIGLKTPLIVAAHEDSASAVNLLIEGGADINARDRISITPLIAGAISNNAAAVHSLLNAGAEVNAHDDRGKTALMWATINGNTHIARALFRAMATRPVRVHPPDSSTRRQAF